MLTSHLSKEKHNFRVYKFTTLANRDYHKERAVFETVYNQSLLKMIVSGIEKGKGCLKLYQLYEKLFKTVVKDDEHSMMKIHLDF